MQTYEKLPQVSVLSQLVKFCADSRKTDQPKFGGPPQPKNTHELLDILSKSLNWRTISMNSMPLHADRRCIALTTAQK